ncbi:PAAR domain-containing protein [Granulicella arctica]|uniref:PAAR domain-containing protein n=1 Tax=Granulicella arctica TaxID=940613 RepID=UPI0021E04D1E|nr:PAAR domain-containing protein [Granulicella arctica]
MPPAARITDMHTCPMLTVLVPHVGGPILPPGKPTVLINYLPAATVTSMATCVGPPDVIVKGSTGVLIGYLPAARLGDLTAHGGVIIMGSPTVMIGEIGSPSPGAAGAGGVVAGLMTSLGLDSAVASIYSVAAKVVDAATKQVAEAGGKFLAGKKSVRAFMLKHSTPDTSQVPFDGMAIGAGCSPSKADDVATVKGIRPTTCAPGATVPKVYFANGINTKLYGDGASMCATMQQIANQTCSEVVGVYGATQGMLPDLDQAVNEIEKNSNSPQAATLAKLVTDSSSANPPQDLNLIVHSRGGLAAQEGIAYAKSSLLLNMPKAEAEEALSHVNVAAFGTAEQGWPVGPVYTKLNNAADSIPAAMKGAQSSFPEQTFGDNDVTPTRYINEPKMDSIAGPHSVTDVYTKHMEQSAGARTCDCS